jgi:RNA polymerase sigma factor (sigma-70 family)
METEPARVVNGAGMPPHRTVVDLLTALSAGGELAPEACALLTEIIGKVTAALRSRHQAADIEDAIAEALLILAQKPHLYRKEEGSLEGFVYVIARNVAARRVRLQSSETATDPEFLMRTVERKHSAERGDADAVLSEMESVPRKPDRRQQVLAELLETLPADQRSIISAFAESGAGEPWAARHARRTGDDPNRIRVRLHRLIAKLRKEIGRRLDGK